MKLSSYYKFSLALSALCILGATTQPADADTPSYTVIDLGTITNTPAGGGESSTEAVGINNLGQVVGFEAVERTPVSPVRNFGFRTAPNSPINPATDDLGTLGVNNPLTFANGLNKSGQVVGSSFGPNGQGAFRTAPNSPINPATDDLGTLGGDYSSATAINQSGQVVGYSGTANRGEGTHAFRTAPNSPINPVTDDLGTLGGCSSYATAINQSGRVVGYLVCYDHFSAFRTARNQAINSATDDLGTLGGTSSQAWGINKIGQVVGSSGTGNGYSHAFRTARNRAIDPATDDLGTLGGTSSSARGINRLGQVVGSSTTASGELHAFLYDARGHLIDLNSLISPDSLSNFSVLTQANAINDRGQIVGFGYTGSGTHAFLATPVKTDEVTTQAAQSPN